MLHYDISFHNNGRLYLRLVDDNPRSNELTDAAVLLEISMRDVQRLTKSIVLITDNSHYATNVIEDFIHKFNEKLLRTPYEYKMLLD
jgi:hypothetical protein